MSAHPPHALHPLLVLAILTSASPALAQAGAATTAEATLDELSVAADTRPPPAAGPGLGGATGGAGGAEAFGALSAPALTSSSGVITGKALNDRPVTRPGEVLEAVPGLIVTQHSGEGKANQYFLRGFNLDHGSDIAITIDGMPANMRTHGHGQGYADINFLIPELVGAVEFHKGPYFARDGDFASAGSVRIDTIDAVPRPLALTSLGSFGYKRALTIASAPLGEGTLLAAGEAQVYDGPWVVPDDIRKLNGVLRYSQGTALDGFSLTGMAYSNRWTATNQIPQRAISEGLIGRFGTLDPSDGGNASRFSLSGRWSRSDDGGVTRASAYVLRSNLNLFNNFTYFLNDPVNGDQFRQLDSRTVAGGEIARVFKGELFGLPMENEIGVQARFDDIHVGLFNTRARTSLSTVRDDRVQEGSAALYFENRLRWTDWLRTSVGLRADAYDAAVRSNNPLNSGHARDGIVSPKLGVVFGPWIGTELFVNYGEGFHSNDARGATITVDPGNPLFPLDRVPLLVRSVGSEVGIRNRSIAGLESTVTLFQLDFDSENLFVGDAGTTEPSRPSRRTGIEWTNHYAVTPWLALDADLTVTHARFADRDPAGSRIPAAPTAIAAAGFTLGEPLGWFGTLRLRYFGPRPLIEDNSVRSKPTTLVNGRIGYNFDNGVTVQLDILNLLNVKASQIDYFYESRLRGEPAGGVADTHLHPVEPMAVRLTVAGRF
ncbi:TonB-dependent receptor [Methylobacterium sp. Leaf93]|uniref:TonB-dependent receptor n=1 Tax=Methylobacterium sp. Leaf93 TaxID=1736249 RepID=UPI0006F52CAF|nr:TonB-dependent receptor [Methylobacterium sp. Leaf93]KQP16797.1 TonB-dependent receptor [Methylobacterium sp. Leaf93]